MALAVESGRSIEGGEIEAKLSGAEAAYCAAKSAGVNVCFANPGTTEMPMVTALDRVGGINSVLGLFEGVCTGAADGYGRMSGKPALTLLHLGPGLGNGIANLHNAKRAHTPVVNLVGDHASWHLKFDAPLTSDIASLARTVSDWVSTVTSADDFPQKIAEAIYEAQSRRCVASLICPVDFQKQTLTTPIAISARQPLNAGFDSGTVDHVASALRGTRGCGLLLGGSGLTESGQRAADRLRAALGLRVFAETFPARAERGRGLPNFDRLPYFPEVAMDALAGCPYVILAGVGKPVSYFGYEGIPSLLVESSKLLNLAGPTEDVASALEDLADALHAPIDSSEAVAAAELAHGELTAKSIADTASALIPEGAIVSVEGGTCGYPFYSASARAARHTILTNTGGAIGQGLPVALGAAIACPDRQVVALQSDGSAQYTIQSLWTMAREGLRTIVLIAANHRYGVLQTELTREGVSVIAGQAEGLTSLERPRMDWTAIAQGYGVPASRVCSAGELGMAFSRALESRGPALIEMAL